ncbi:hypothetical protein [Cronobacter sakazakii]|uniref:hypothetical protein n=1 Tax=Cronobacter sakazakii TaxID=28141 RepID=UPI001F19F6C9|nr:hypothetical protein [Cronobacter sakazakii]
MTEETKDEFRIKEGGIRLLTPGEIMLAQSVLNPLLTIRKSGSTGKVICPSIFRIEMQQ